MGEPIAIVGMACKFPGAPDLESFWNLLESGGNAVTEGDPSSGMGRLGEIFQGSQVQNEACRYGAFVDDIDQFDAAFFRISPVEAELLDPQQRMMLEASWLALEDAAIDPVSLKGSRTGVYTGISNDEYRMLVVESSGPSEAAGSLYALSGTNLNGTSGRVSFVLGLMGPAKAVDAACASAMVAVDDAVSDLQAGKADLAIAGGVQAILNGRIYELRAESMMLSPDGQCKTFDASADGYVRGEGCGVVVLKRLSDAEAAGDRIWAVIRGSAVNHGGASVGLTVPHTPALEQVMETALADAGVHASDVEYVEAHGTGTAVGDPIELEAVASVYACGRQADQPLLIGSVKTNVGHLESAAGIAGLIKAALVVKQGIIPKHLHFRNPNPGFDWEAACNTGNRRDDGLAGSSTGGRDWRESTHSEFPAQMPTWWWQSTWAWSAMRSTIVQQALRTMYRSRWKPPQQSHRRNKRLRRAQTVSCRCPVSLKVRSKSWRRATCRGSMRMKLKFRWTTPHPGRRYRTCRGRRA